MQLCHPVEIADLTILPGARRSAAPPDVQDILVNDQISAAQALLLRLGTIPIAGEQERAPIPKPEADRIT